LAVLDVMLNNAGFLPPDARSFLTNYSPLADFHLVMFSQPTVLGVMALPRRTRRARQMSDQ